MTDNIQKIVNYIDRYFTNSELGKEEFFCIQILKRKKDGHNYDSVIKEYNVSSGHYLQSKADEIRKMCDCFNARAYMYVNPRNMVRITAEIIKRFSEHLINGSYVWDIPVVFRSACGSMSAKQCTWIIDIDNCSQEIAEAIADRFTNMCGVEPIDILKTRSGYHIMTPRCDIRQFKSEIPSMIAEYNCKDIEIKRDAMTILYENINVNEI